MHTYAIDVPISVTKEKRVMSLTHIKAASKTVPGQFFSKGWIPAGSLKKHFEYGLFGIFPQCAACCSLLQRRTAL